MSLTLMRLLYTSLMFRLLSEKSRRGPSKRLGAGDKVTSYLGICITSLCIIRCYASDDSIVPASSY